MAAAAERGAGLPAEPPPPAPRGARPAPLGSEEVSRRLAATRRELSNRRKILLRNLPAESSSQEIHDLFKDYEIKYCYVDRNKRTAFVTLLNGEQAQNAIQKFHQYSLRGKEISVQLQPTDALLCITNLPISFTLEEFEELVRAYGNVERCFLVYNEVTGHSKGYGFVEYMKKDSAAKARLELLGKQLDESTLFAQWMDVNQLTTNLIHSKCLCVDKLQKDCSDSKELLQAFSLQYKPVFCQNSILGNTSNLLLQSPAHLPLPQQQLMKMENIQANSKPASNLPPIQTAAAAAGMGLLPFFPNQHIVGQAITGQNNAPDKALTAEGVVSGSQPYHQSVTNIAAGALRAGHAKQQNQLNQLKSTDTTLGPPSKKQTSLLGEPPKEIRLSTNPYLNLASVLPGICLPAIASKASSPPQQSGLSNNIVDAAVSQGTASQHAMENYFNYAQQHGEYTQVAPARSEKRGSSYLVASPEPGPVEYLGQHAQGSAVRYAESSLKKKRVY